MKRIPLTQGKYALVDDADFEWLSKYKWYAIVNKRTYYVATSIKIDGKYYSLKMHRMILGLEKGDGKLTDHRNHNGLDNQRHNIRICTNSQNLQNMSILRVGKSKYKGVHWRKRISKWMAQIMLKGKTIYIGGYDSEIEAAKAYDDKARELFGEYANCNFI